MKWISIKDSLPQDTSIYYVVLGDFCHCKNMPHIATYSPLSEEDRKYEIEVHCRDEEEFIENDHLFSPITCCGRYVTNVTYWMALLPNETERAIARRYEVD